MNVVEKEKAQETKRQLYYKQGGRCATCGMRLAGGFDLAHKIPQTKTNLKKYGKEVIHHPLNMACTCHRADCNDAQMINPATRPVEAEELVKKIKKALASEKGGNRE